MTFTVSRGSQSNFSIAESIEIYRTIGIRLPKKHKNIKET